MDEVSQIVNGLLALVIIVVIGGIVIYWIAFPIIVTRELRRIRELLEIGKRP